MDDTPSTRRKLLKRPAFISLCVLFGLGLTMLMIGVFWLRGDDGNKFLQQKIVAYVEQMYPNAKLSIAQLDTDILSEVSLKNVRLESKSGDDLLRLDELKLQYDITEVWNQSVPFVAVHLSNPKVYLISDAKGNNWTQVFRSDPSPPPTTESTAWQGSTWRVSKGVLSIQNAQFYNVSRPVDGKVVFTKPQISDLNINLETSVGLGKNIDLKLRKIEGVFDNKFDLKSTGSVALINEGIELRKLMLSYKPSNLKTPPILKFSADGKLASWGAKPDGQITMQLSAASNAFDFLLTNPTKEQHVLGKDIELKLQLKAEQDKVVGAGSLVKIERAANPKTPVGDQKNQSESLQLTVGVEKKQGAAMGPPQELWAWNLGFTSEQFDVYDLLPLYVGKQTSIAGQYEVSGTGLSATSAKAKLIIHGKKQSFWGQPLNNLNVDADYQNGVLQFHQLEADHAIGHVDMKGQLFHTSERKGMEVQAKLELDDLAKLQFFGVKGLQGKTRLNGLFSMDWQGDFALRYRPELEFQGFQYPSITIANGGGDIDIQYLTGKKSNTKTGTKLSITGPIYGEKIVAYTTRAHRLRTNFAMLWDGKQTAIDNELKLEKIRLANDAVIIDELSGPLRLEQGRTTRLESNALRFSRIALVSMESILDSGSIQVLLDDDEVKLGLGIQHAERDWLSIKANGSIANMSGEVASFSFQPLSKVGWRLQKPIVYEPNGSFDVVLQGTDKSVIGVMRKVDKKREKIGLQIKNLDLHSIAEVSNLLLGAKVIDPSISGRLSSKITLRSRVSESNGGSLALEQYRFGNENFMAIEGLHYADYLKSLNFRTELKGALLSPSLRIKIGSTKRPDILKVRGKVPFQQHQSPYIDCAKPIQLTTTLAPVQWKQIYKLIPAVSEQKLSLGLSLEMSGQSCNPSFRIFANAAVPVGSYSDQLKVDFLLKRKTDEKLTLSTMVQHNLKPEVTLKGQLKGPYNDVIQPYFRGTPIPSHLSKDGALDTYKLIQLLRSDVKVSFHKIQLEKYLQMFEVPNNLKAKLLGEVHVKDNLLSPSIDGKLELMKAKMGKILVLNSGLQFISGKGFVQVKGGAAVGQSTVKTDGEYKRNVDFEAKLPFSPSEEVSAHVKMKALPFGMWNNFVSGLRVEDYEPIKNAFPTVIGVKKEKRKQGSQKVENGLFVDLQLTGTYEEIRPKLQLNVVGGTILYSPLGLQLDNVGLRVEGSHRVLKIHRFTAISKVSDQLNLLQKKKNNLRLEGKIRWKNFVPYEGEFKLNTDGFCVSNTPKNRLVITSNLEAEYKKETIDLSGNVTLDDGLLTIDDTIGGTNSLSLNPTIQIHRKRRKTKEPVAAEVDLPMKGKVDLNLGTGLDLRVKIPIEDQYGGQLAKLSTASFDSKMTGDLTVNFRKNIELSGKVKTSRGELEVLGVDFTLDDSQVSYFGGDPSDPTLDLVAIRRVGRYGDIYVYITGTANNPKIRFQAKNGPEDYNQTDIIALLLFGKPASELGDAEGGNLLMSAAMSSFGGSVSQFIGGRVVDEINWDPGSGQFRIGKSLGDRLFFVYERRDEAEEDENENQITLEWLIINQMYAEFVTGSENVSSMDLYYRWLF